MCRLNEKPKPMMSTCRPDAVIRPIIWRRNRWLKAGAGLAACLAMLAAVSLIWGNGAQKTFAAAIGRVQHARTFSCKVVVESDRDGQGRASYAYTVAFKEPNLYRYECLMDSHAPTFGEVIVEDYGRQIRLISNPADKTASLEDLRGCYEVDMDSGQVERRRLHTNDRDELLSIVAAAVEDLDVVQLDGQSVRLLRSQKGERITSAWVHPQTGLPVQIRIERPHSSVLFSSIRIDEEMSDNLFSLQPPAGYTLFKNGVYNPSSDDRMARMTAKIMRVGMLCLSYREKHGRMPAALSDLAGGDIGEAALNTLLAAPDQPEGPAVIRYRVPRPDREPGKEIMLYEAFDTWPAGGMMVGFADGHAGHVVTQAQFEELMR